MNSKLPNDIKLYDLTSFKDKRGCFYEAFNPNVCYDLQLNENFIQMNISINTNALTLRGLHLQHANPQSKLIHVLQGQVYDVIACVNPLHKHYGQYWAVLLSDLHPQLLYIPKGYAHGFLTLVPDTKLIYWVDQVFVKGDNITIAYDDEQLNIVWPFITKSNPPIISEKDQVEKLSLSSYINWCTIKTPLC